MNRRMPPASIIQASNQSNLRSIKTDVPGGIQIATKKKQGGFVAWLRMDLEGNVTTIEADKYDMMHRVGLHARDLRILDPLLSYPSTILGRERAIVLNLEHVKAIITADEVLLRNSTNENVLQFVEELKRQLADSKVYHTSHATDNKNNSNNKDKEVDFISSDEEKETKILIHGSNGRHDHASHLINNNDLTVVAEYNSDEAKDDTPTPFEFQALEAALDSVCQFLDSKVTELENSVVRALDTLITKISSINLERVRKLKNGLSRLSVRVNKVREELEQLLDDDDDMAEMFLTRKLGIPGSPSNSNAFSSIPNSPSALNSRISIYLNYEDDGDVEELEQILEAYFMQVDATCNKLNTLREYIDDTEDYINIQLDNHRNQLIQLELILSSATLAISLYSVIAGIFGMNIPYAWNSQSKMFGWVVIMSSLCTFFLFFVLICYARYRRIIS